MLLGRWSLRLVEGVVGAVDHQSRLEVEEVEVDRRRMALAEVVVGDRRLMGVEGLVLHLREVKVAVPVRRFLLRVVEEGLDLVMVVEEGVMSQCLGLVAGVVLALLMEVVEVRTISVVL